MKDVDFYDEGAKGCKVPPSAEEMKAEFAGHSRRMTLSSDRKLVMESTLP